MYQARAQHLAEEIQALWYADNKGPPSKIFGYTAINWEESTLTEMDAISGRVILEVDKKQGVDRGVHHGLWRL